MRQFYLKKTNYAITVILLLLTCKPLTTFSQKIQTIVHSSSTVSTFVVKNDTIWMGTTSGIVIMGKNKEIISTYPTINGINNINFFSSAIDNSGDLWFGSDKGIFVFSEGNWNNYYQDRWVLDIEVDIEGNIWFGTNGGILKYKNGWSSITEGLSEQIVWAIFNDSNNNLWAGTTLGLDKFNGVSWENFNTSDGLTDNNILDINEDKSGNLWVGTSNGGVSKYDGTNWQSYLESEQIFSVEIINDTVWFGSHNGAFKFSEIDTINFKTSEGLLDNYVKSIFIDENSSVWFNNLIGITEYDYISLETYSITNNLANNFVRSIAIDTLNNTKWIGTDNGISVFDGINWTTFNTSDGLTANFIKNIKIDSDNNKWIATNNGVSFYDGNTWTNYNAELITNDTRSISIDTSGNVWIGTYLGLNKFNGSTWSSYTVNEGIIDNNIITTYIDKNDDLWLGTISGVSLLKDENWTNYTTSDGLVSNYVSAIIQDTLGNYWFGTDNGFSKFDGTDWTSYGNDLETIFCLEIDKLNNLWIGTLDGVYVLEKDSLKHYNEFDNLAGNNIFAIEVDKEGFKWIGCNKGLTFFNYYPESSDTTLTYESGSKNLSESSILKIKAKDADGNNLKFSIEDNSNTQNIFKINQLTGDITTNNVDTLTKTYVLDIKITDGKASTNSKVTLTFINSSNNIENNNKISEYRIFPNPAINYIIIDKSNNDEAVAIQLIDMTGKTILRKAIKDGESGQIKLDLPDLKIGTYILNLKHADKSVTHKLIIN
ncbi:MAG: two-component regulator propeller domain-containing protein [Bacteroidales bacterium]